MKRIVFLVVLLIALFAVPAIASDGDGSSSTAKYLAVAGANLFGSFLLGKVQKAVLPKKRRDVIPASNPTICGGSTLAITGGDPVSAMVGVGASLLSTFIHQAFKRYR